MPPASSVSDSRSLCICCLVDKLSFRSTICEPGSLGLGSSVPMIRTEGLIDESLWPFAYPFIAWDWFAGNSRVSAPPSSYMDRTLFDKASSSADKTLVGRLIAGDMGDLEASRLRLPMTLPFGCVSSLLTIAFLPPSSMLPLFENSSCPGLVRSSKLLVGISVKMLMEGNCVNVELADNCEPPLAARSLEVGDLAASRGGAA